MKSFIAALLPTFGLAAVISPKLLTRQDGGSNCEVLSEGPGEAAKQAVGDFFRNTYITVKACPAGDPPTTVKYGNWCGVCQGAALYFNNAHSDISEVCFTVDEFNEAFDTMSADGQTCSANMKDDPYLQLLYGKPDDFDHGGEQPCTNVC